MNELHKCPVCKGKRIVPMNFYNRYPFEPWCIGTFGVSICRSCWGQGYIIIYSFEPQLQKEFTGNLYGIPKTTG